MMPTTEASQSTTPHRPNRNSSAKGRGEESRRESGRALMTTPSAAWCRKTTGAVGKMTPKGMHAWGIASYRTAACVIYDPHKACFNAWSPWNMHLLRKKCKMSYIPNTYQQVPHTKRRGPCVCVHGAASACARRSKPFAVLSFGTAAPATRYATLDHPNPIPPINHGISVGISVWHSKRKGYAYSYGHQLVKIRPSPLEKNPPYLSVSASYIEIQS